MSNSDEPDAQSNSLQRVIRAINWLLLLTGIDLQSQTGKDLLIHGLNDIRRAILHSEYEDYVHSLLRNRHSVQNVCELPYERDLGILFIIPTASKDCFRVFSYMTSFPDHSLATLGMFETSHWEQTTDTTHNNLGAVLDELRSFTGRCLATGVEWLVMYCPRIVGKIDTGRTSLVNLLGMKRNTEQYIPSFDYKYYDHVARSIVRASDPKDRWRLVRLDYEEVQEHRCRSSHKNDNNDETGNSVDGPIPADCVDDDASHCHLGTPVESMLNHVLGIPMSPPSNRIYTAILLTLLLCEECGKRELSTVYDTIRRTSVPEKKNPSGTCKVGEEAHTEPVYTPESIATANNLPITRAHMVRYAHQFLRFKKLLGYLLRRRLQRNTSIAMRSLHLLTTHGSARYHPPSPSVGGDYMPHRRHPRRRVGTDEGGLSRIVTTLRKVVKGDEVSTSADVETVPKKIPFAKMLLALNALALSHIANGKWEQALEAIDEIEHSFERLFQGPRASSGASTRAPESKSTVLRSSAPIVWEEESTFYKLWKEWKLDYIPNAKLRTMSESIEIGKPNGLQDKGWNVYRVDAPFFVPVLYRRLFQKTFQGNMVSILDFRWYICAHQCWMLHLLGRRGELLDVASSFAQWLFEIKTAACSTQGITVTGWHSWLTSIIFDMFEIAMATPLSMVHHFPMKRVTAAPVTTNDALLFQTDDSAFMSIPDPLIVDSGAISNHVPPACSPIPPGSLSGNSACDAASGSGMEAMNISVAPSIEPSKTNPEPLRIEGRTVSTMELSELLCPGTISDDELGTAQNSQKVDKTNVDVHDAKAPPNVSFSWASYPEDQLDDVNIADVWDTPALLSHNHDGDSDTYVFVESVTSAKPGYEDIITDDSLDPYFSGIFHAQSTSMSPTCAGSEYMQEKHRIGHYSPSTLAKLHAKLRIGKRDATTSSPNKLIRRDLLMDFLGLRASKTPTDSTIFARDTAPSEEGLGELHPSQCHNAGHKWEAPHAASPDEHSNGELTSLYQDPSVALEPIVLRLWILLLQSLLSKYESLEQRILVSAGGSMQERGMQYTDAFDPLHIGTNAHLYKEICAAVGESKSPLSNEQSGNINHAPHAYQYPPVFSHTPLSRVFLACVQRLDAMETPVHQEEEERIESLSLLASIVMYVFDCTIHSAGVSAHNRTRLMLEEQRIHWMARPAVWATTGSHAHRSRTSNETHRSTVPMPMIPSKPMTMLSWTRLHRAFFETNFTSLLAFPSTFARLVLMLTHCHLKYRSMQEARSFVTEVLKNCEETKVDFSLFVCGDGCPGRPYQSKNIHAHPQCDASDLHYVGYLCCLLGLDSLLPPQ